MKALRLLVMELASLDAPIFSGAVTQDLHRLGADIKCEIINTLWPNTQITTSDFIDQDYGDFFEFIGRILRNISPHASYFAIQDLRNLTLVITRLRTNPTWTRENLTDEIQKDYPHSDRNSIMRSLELATRVWSGVDIRSTDLPMIGQRDPQDTWLGWTSNMPLNQLIATRFHHKASRHTFEEYALDESLTAMNLQSICRIRIRWTNNLIDHLKIKGPRGDRTVSIYRHKICLINHALDPELKIIDREVLHEAIRTLDPLFPFGDAKTMKMLKSNGMNFHTLPSPEHSHPFDLSEFKYWRNDLARLLQFLCGPPESLTQTLLDTRNIAQFATFWLAIFGVFGLTIMFGVLATVYSVKQYNVTVLSYNLALAVACNDAPGLPVHCATG